MEAQEPKTLTSFVTPGLLRRLAGERSFDRGEAYFTEGAVRSLRPDESSVKATVQGTHRYRVHLWAEGGDFGYDCNCPIGREGECCKHCVAVGLAFHAANQNDDPDIAGHMGTAGKAEDLRAYLLGLAKTDLVSLLLDLADDDDRLHRRLTLRAAQASPGTLNLSLWKGALEEVLGSGDLTDYRDAYSYAEEIEEVVDSLEDLLRAGQADGVIQLAEHGLSEIEDCMEYMDDSDGWMSGHLHRLQELHLEACRVARPDPVKLAERLFEMEMASSFDTFHQAALVYRDILGETGRAAYRQLVETDWAKVPVLKPGDEDPDRYGRRYRVTSIMAALARADGDLAALVAVKSRDLSQPYAYLEIASLYEDAGEPALALDWAERGWRAFPGAQRDERLRAFIAKAYQGQGRRDEAMALIWEAFADQPDLGTFGQLEQHGRRAKQWANWRERALGLIRERIADKSTDPPGGPRWMRGTSRDHSLLVEIFLHEGDEEAAWREAQAGGCSQRLWLALAKRRETAHPEDSVRIYQAHIDSLLRHTGDRVYQDAVGMLQTIEQLLARSGREGAFRSLLTDLRTVHKRKRNLMKMLDKKGW